MANESGKNSLDGPAELPPLDEDALDDSNLNLEELFAGIDFRKPAAPQDIEEVILANMGTIHLFADAKDALRLLGGYILPKAEITKLFPPSSLSILAKLQTLSNGSIERREVNNMLRSYFGTLENQRNIEEAQKELVRGLEQVAARRRSERN